MSLLLDTNVVSELRRGPRADANVRAWFDGVDDEAVYLSVLVVGAIRRGVARLARRDPAAAQHLQAWLDDLVAAHAKRILPIDRRIAERWGTLSAPDPLPTVDGLLAATALEHDMVLVTRNVRDVQGTGVRWLDPFVKSEDRQD